MLDDHTPRIATLEGQIIAHSNRMDKHYAQLQNHDKRLEDLKETKVNIKDDRLHRQELKKRMKEINQEHGVLTDQQLSLESYVEKYLPLRLQHQMAESVMDCFNKKDRLKFKEYNDTMAEALRDEIIKDCGHPKLKDKCLDLISKLRIETNLLNPTKNAKNTMM